MIYFVDQVCRFTDSDPNVILDSAGPTYEIDSTLEVNCTTGRYTEQIPVTQDDIYSSIGTAKNVVSFTIQCTQTSVFGAPRYDL